MTHFFKYIFSLIGVIGLKIRLKGKISAAGNSRKRVILYRVGESSHSKVSLRVLNELDTVTTFTGTMGLDVSIFY